MTHGVTQEPAPDADALDRWMAIQGLLGIAHEMFQRADTAGLVVSLATMDAAQEAMLWLLAGRGELPPEKGERDKLLAAAMAGAANLPVPISSSLGVRLRRAHRVRNLAVHQGVPSTSAEVGRALDAVDELAAVLASWSSLFDRAAGGLLEAVARLVDHPEVTPDLLAAVEALQREQGTIAADSLARGLDRTLMHLDPPLLPPDANQALPTPFDRDVSRTVRSALEGLSERDDAQEVWLLSLAIGVPAAQLAQLRGVIGVVIWTFGSQDVTRASAPTLEQVRDAADTVAGVVYRLWRNGTLSQKHTGAAPRLPGPTRTWG